MKKTTVDSCHNMGKSFRQYIGQMKAGILKKKSTLYGLLMYDISEQETHTGQRIYQEEARENFLQ